MAHNELKNSRFYITDINELKNSTFYISDIICHYIFTSVRRLFLLIIFIQTFSENSKLDVEARVFYHSIESRNCYDNDHLEFICMTQQTITDNDKFPRDFIAFLKRISILYISF